MYKENDRMLQTLDIDSQITVCKSTGARKFFLIEEAMAAALSASTA
jgi:hypothetical protein